MRYKRAVLEATILWLSFAVSSAVLPFGAIFVQSLDRKQPLSFVDLFGRGELLLVSVPLVTASLAVLLLRREAQRAGASPLPRLIAQASAILVITGADLLFAAVRVSAQVNTSLTATTSVVVFALAVIVSGMCVILAEPSG